MFWGVASSISGVTGHILGAQCGRECRDARKVFRDVPHSMHVGYIENGDVFLSCFLFLFIWLHVVWRRDWKCGTKLISSCYHSPAADGSKRLLLWLLWLFLP